MKTITCPVTPIVLYSGVYTSEGPEGRKHLGIGAEMEEINRSLGAYAGTKVCTPVTWIHHGQDPIVGCIAFKISSVFACKAFADLCWLL